MQFGICQPLKALAKKTIVCDFVGVFIACFNIMEISGQISGQKKKSAHFQGQSQKKMLVKCCKGKNPRALDHLKCLETNM